MSLAPVLLVLGNAGLAALMLGTYRSPLGDARWQHDLAYAALGLATLAALPALRRRRLTTLLLASLGAWSMLTGFFLVYVTPGLGHGRWMGWWHGTTSVGFLLAFFVHWARNNARLVGLAKRLAQRPAGLSAVVAAWALLAVAAWGSWGTPLRGLFTDTAFWDLTTLAFAAIGVALLYVLVAARTRRVRALLDAPAARNRVRGAVDASLLATTWLVALTGLPLLYFGRDLRGLDAYWLVAGWHVLASALLLGLVACHAGFNARPLLSHAR